jgi:hypothetical protein
MKYACLVYHQEEKLNALAEAELAALVRECLGWIEDLEQGGHHVFSAGLQSARTATTARKRGGTVSMTDGPFAETKEFLGGFTILEARDLNEALHLVSKFPAGGHIGSVEVRPVLELDAEFMDPLDRKLDAAIGHLRPL